MSLHRLLSLERGGWIEGVEGAEDLGFIFLT